MGGGLACLDVRAHRARESISRQANVAPPVGSRDGLACLDVSRYTVGGGISRRAKGAPGSDEKEGVGVPGCEGPQGFKWHFQAGQRRTSDLSTFMTASLSLSRCSRAAFAACATRT